MMSTAKASLIGAAALLTALQAPAATIGLFDWAFNIDGTLTSQAAPAGVSLAAFDTTTGLGTISITLSGAGPRYVALFADHEIDEAINTYFNESGSTTGAAAAGQSWEIDEPGFVFGDIYTHLTAGALDNANALPAGAEDDVSMALAWDFVLTAGQTAAIQFTITADQPAGGFYLTQFDPDSQAAVHFASSLAIREEGGSAAEPGTVALLGLGLLGTWISRRRRVDRTPYR